MSKYAFGVDVGGTTVKLGLFNDKGQVLDKWEIPTVKDNGGEKVLPDIAASIKNKMQEKNISVEELVGVGIGAPGAVDADGYMVNGAVNIGWGAFDLAETLKKELDQQYADIKAQGLALDMSRGKPGTDQLDLSMGMKQPWVKCGRAVVKAIPIW